MRAARAGLTVAALNVAALTVASLTVAAGAAALAAPEDPPPAGGKEPGSAEARPDAEAAAKALEDALRAVGKSLAGLKTLRASFTQTKRLEVFEEDVVSRGTLAIATPSKLRWEFTEPLKTVLVVDGDRAVRVRTSRKGERKVSRFALADDPVASATAEQIFLWTKGDFETARKSYGLSLVAAEPVTIRAVPRDERVAKVVTSIELRFAKDLSSLVGVTLEERAEGKTVIEFSDVRRDAELPDGLFRVDD